MRVGRRVRVDVARGARLVLGAGCVLGNGSTVLVRGGEVRLGAGTEIGDGCRIVADAGVVLGERCVLGPQAAVMDAEPGRPPAPVSIGDGVVLGPGAAVLAGAVVPSGAVLGARSVTGGAMSCADAARP